MPTDKTEIQRIVRNYYEKPSAKKFENLGEMDKFLEKYYLPKLNEEAESLNRPITADEIEAIIKKLPELQSQKPWTGQFHRRILLNIQGRANPHPAQIISKNSRRWKTPKLVL